MRKKLLTISMLLVLSVVLYKAGTVLAQALTLPRVETACETRFGTLFTKDNGDGYNRMKSCPIGSREVVLGSESTGGSSDGSAPVIGDGTISFVDIYPTTGNGLGAQFLLKNDGTSWILETQWGGVDGRTLVSSAWVRDATMDLPMSNGVQIKASDLASWRRGLFATKNGEIWVHTSQTHMDTYESDVWVKTN